MKWLDKFKIALIEEDIDTVNTLINEMPEFKKIDDMRSAYILIGEAKDRFKQEQLSIFKQMSKIQKAKKFLNTKEKTHRLDAVY